MCLHGRRITRSAGVFAHSSVQIEHVSCCIDTGTSMRRNRVFIRTSLSVTGVMGRVVGGVIGNVCCNGVTYGSYSRMNSS